MLLVREALGLAQRGDDDDDEDGDGVGPLTARGVFGLSFEVGCVGTTGVGSPTETCIIR